MDNFEIKLFLTTFLINLLFIHLVGWNELSRLYTTIEIANNNTFLLPKFYLNYTGDIMKIDKPDYFISTKMPAISIFSLLIYYIFKFNEQLFFIFSTVFLSVLPSSFTLIFLLKILRKRLLAMALYFSSQLFVFAHVLFPYSLTTFFLTLSIYLNLSKKDRIISSILISLLLLIDIINLPLVILIYLLILKLDKKFFIIGILPFIIYSLLFPQVYFKRYINLIEISYYYNKEIREIFQKSNINFNLLERLFNNLINVTFSFYRGVFIFYPFLLLPIFLLNKLERRYKLFTLIFIVYILISSFTAGWYGGSSISVRYIIPSLPLILVTFKNIWKYKKLNIILIILFSYSTLVNITTLSTYWEDVGHIENYYKFEFFDHKKISNSIFFISPIYEHYLPAFLDEGPRSRILEYLLIGEIPDIRDFKPMPARDIKLFTLEPFGILVLKMPFLIIPILMLLITLIWRKELLYIKIFRRVSLPYVLLLVAFFLLISRLQFKDLVYDTNWYPLGKNETTRWMAEKAKIYVFSENEKNVFLNISHISYRNKTMILYFNGENLGEFGGQQILERMRLRKGENVLEIISKGGCEIPLLKENSSDWRCLSFGIQNISLTNSLPSNEVVFGSGWYPLEKNENYTFRFASKETTIFLPKHEEEIKLNISIETYKKPRIVKLFLNEKLIGEYEINEFFTQILTPSLNLNNTVNVLKIVTDACEIPAFIEKNSSDYRCLSFLVKNISLISLKEIQEKNITFLFGRGWYSGEKDLTHSNGKAEIFYYSPADIESLLHLTIVPSIANITRNVEILVNNVNLGEFRIDGIINIVVKPVKLKKGENLIEIISREECIAPVKIGKSDDKRCLSFALFNISRIILSEKKPIFAYGFFPQEKEGRWLEKNSTIFVYSENATLAKLQMSLDSYLISRTVLLKVNDRIISKFVVDKGRREYLSDIFTLTKGINKIELVSSSCDIPALKENSSDYRCLSIFLSNLTFITRKVFYEDNFFDEENYPAGKFRWFSEKGNISILTEKDGVYKISFDIWSFNRNRTVNIYLDNTLFNSIITLPSINKISFFVFLKEGEHRIAFVSDGCEYPFNDPRCLSNAIGNLNISQINIDKLDVEGIHGLEITQDKQYFRWLSNETKIEIFSPIENSVLVYLTFGWSYYKPRNVSIFINEEKAKEVSIEKEKSVSLPIKLKAGNNSIVLKSTCDIPALKERSSDKRCLSVSIKSFNIS